jgi:hypothetical protein
VSTVSRQATPLDAFLDQLAEAVAIRVAARLTDCWGEREHQNHESKPDFWSEIDVSRRTGLSRRTLQGWRSAGRGPKFTKTGRRVLYPVAELQDFLRARSALNGSRAQQISDR